MGTLARLQGSECQRGSPELGQSLPLLPAAGPAVTRRACLPHSVACSLVGNRGSGSPPPAPLWVSLLSRKSWGLPC